MAMVIVLQRVLGERGDEMTTVVDYIRLNNLEEIAKAAKTNSAVLSTLYERRLPIVVAVMGCKLPIVKFLLDEGVDPVQDTQDVLLKGCHLARYCCVPERIQVLELLYLHEKSGQRVFTIFKDVLVSYDEEYAYVLPWVKKLRDDLRNYHSGNPLTRLRILEKRLTQNEIQKKEFIAKGYVEDSVPIKNSEWIIDFLIGLRNECRKPFLIQAFEILKQEMGAEAVLDKEQVYKLFKLLDYSLDALRPAAQHMHQKGISLAEYRHQYRTYRRGVLAEIGQGQKRPTSLEVALQMLGVLQKGCEAQRVPVANLVDVSDSGFFGASEGLRQRNQGSSSSSGGPALQKSQGSDE